MASNSVLKPTHDSGFHESDPLAELSRIMGLAREEAANADADFQIDLEQELMGAFSDDEPRAQANDAVAPTAPVEAVAVENEFDDVFADMFEQEAFDAPLDMAADEPVAMEEIPVVEEDATDAFIEDDFVGAFAADDLAEAEFGAVEEQSPAPQDGEAAEMFADDDLSELDAAFRDLDAQEEPSFAVEADDAPEMAPETPAAAMPEPEDTTMPQMSFEPAMSLEDELSALLGASEPAATSDETAAQHAEPARDVALETFEGDEISAGFDAAFDGAAFAVVPEEETIFEVDEPEPVADEWTAELAVEQLFEADQGDDLLPNPLSVEHHADEDAPSLAEAETVADDFDDIAFDDADLDFALSAEIEEDSAAEIVLQQPETAELDAAEDLESAIAEFADDNAWTAPPAVQLAPVAPVAETRAAPVSTFNWQTLRSVAPPVAERAPEPVASAAPDYDDADPFAALAALAAAPPIMRTLARTNPVAVNPPPVEASAPRSFAAPQPVRMPAAPAPAFAPSVQRAEVAQPRPVPPVTPLGLRPALSTGAAASAFTASPLAARPVVETPVSKTPVAPVPVQAFEDDDFPDLDELLDGANFAPDVDTVDIQDEAVALADDFDIPDFDIDPQASQSAQFDDLDNDFTSAFNQLSNTLDQRSSARSERVQPAMAPTYYVDRAPTAAVVQQAHAPSSYATDDYDAQFAGFDASLTDADPFADNDEFAVDPYDQDMQEDDGRPTRSRGLLIAAIVAGVAIVGGVGAYALSFGGAGGDDVPALVKADTTPVKVKPETPGGVVVPNQDGKVYQQVSGAPAPAPAQEKLISTAEEPIAPAAAAPAAAPAADATLPGVDASQVKSEERVTPADTAQTPPETQDVTAIAPKKVRTMIVRPDGTLVAREDLPAAPIAAAPAPDAVTTGMTPVPSAADPATMAAVEPATVPVPSAVPGAQDDVSILPPADEAATEGVATPSAADVIVPAPRPSRAAAPAAEPVRAAEPEPARAAAPEPARPAPAAEPVVEVASAPAAAAPSLWSVQIASQPTREGAQASYEDLARRYGGVLGGKGVNIVQAEVTGKGTMWRVRVPSASKNDANILCAKLKTAGGSCFVSQ